MKIVLALGIFLLLTFQSFSQSEWTWANPKPFGGVPIYDLQYFNNTILVAAAGGVIKSTDNGNSWKLFHIGDGYNIHFKDVDNGIVGGKQNYYITTDGGVSWSRTVDPILNKSLLNHENYFGEVYLFNKENYLVAFGGSTYEHLSKTTNGGITWEGTLSDFFNQIQFVDSNIGVVAASQGLWKTTDGGLTWAKIAYSASSVSMIDSVNYSAVQYDFALNSSVIIKTIDGGASFTSKQFNNIKLNKVVYTDAYNAIVVGDSGIVLRTTDGGESWSNQPSGITYNLSNVSFSDNLNGIASSSTNIYGSPGNYIIRTTNGGISWFPIYNSITSVNLNDVSFADQNIGVTVGDSGVILRTIDSGNSWTKQTSIVSDNIIQVDLTKGKGFAYTNKGLFLKTSDKGNTWITQTSGTKLKKVYFNNDSIGFGINENVILRTSNGGQTWFVLMITPYNLLDIQFTDENNGVIIGYTHSNPPNAIMRTTNGGRNWITNFKEGEYSFVRGVFFTDSLTGYVVGLNDDPTAYIEFGFISKTTNGGANWFGSRWFSFGYLNNVTFFNKEIGIAVGSKIFKTTNAGNTWVSGFSGIISKAFCISPDRAVAVGANGLILVADKNVLPVELTNFSTSNEFSLSQCYPNPFNPTTKINYTIAKGGNASLIIYDVLGREVKK
ncbi:MAG: WD40/YVTN/BNR-like repeat-containing protein, partial [Syntrophothermus sp.]